MYVNVACHCIGLTCYTLYFPDRQPSLESKAGCLRHNFIPALLSDQSWRTAEATVILYVDISTVTSAAGTDITVMLYVNTSVDIAAV